jgi:hypothetical protein
MQKGVFFNGQSNDVADIVRRCMLEGFDLQVHPGSLDEKEKGEFERDADFLILRQRDSSILKCKRLRHIQLLTAGCDKVDLPRPGMRQRRSPDNVTIFAKVIAAAPRNCARAEIPDHRPPAELGADLKIADQHPDENILCKSEDVESMAAARLPCTPGWKPAAAKKNAFHRARADARRPAARHGGHRRHASWPKRRRPGGTDPVLPVDVSTDHSLPVDFTPVGRQCKTYGEMRLTPALPLRKWASSTLMALRVHPPGTGIMHTITSSDQCRRQLRRSGILWAFPS